MTRDIINQLAGLADGSSLAATRATRPEFVDGAEACRAAVLEPALDVGLGRPLRAALAARMARLNADETLASFYRGKLAGLGDDPVMLRIAEGGYPDAVDQRLRAILRHTDFITVAPRACTRADTERLVAHGLTVPEVIALAELIGFLNFEVRILATLNLLKAQP
jgi:uncharacterized protein YciW